jgi:hypothetical protein
MTQARPDGDALIRARRGDRARFQKELARQRELGFSDAEIAQAMTDSLVLVDAVGDRRPPRRRSK